MTCAVALLLTLMQSPQLNLVGKPVAQALREIEAQGITIVFSEDLVRPDMKVREQPKSTRLTDVVNEILAPHGLTTRVAENGALVVVLKFAESVEVAGAEPENIGRKPIAVPAVQVTEMAGGLENVFHTLSLLPGVTATSDFGSRQSVRGGGPDENLIVMDHIELHNPYRLFGFVSGINPETVQKFELHAGAFSAQYGDRLSSLLVIDTRDGSTKKAVQGLASASITDANIVLEGRLPDAQRGSWLVTARRTYYDVIAGRLSTDIKKFPGFTDGQFKVVWNPAQRWRLTFHGLASGESMDLSDDTASALGLKNTATAHTRTTLFGATAEGTIAGQALLRSTLATSVLKDRFDFTSDGCSSPLVENAPDGNGGCFGQFVVGHEASTNDTTFREELGIPAGTRHAIDAGFQARVMRNTLSVASENDDFPAIAVPGLGLLGIGRLPWHAANMPFGSSVDGNMVGAWIEDRMQAASWLSIVPGVRLDHIAFTHETLISPRFAFSMALGSRTTVTGSSGVHYQSPGYDKAFLGGAAFAVDLTSPAASNLKSERAVQAVVGVERELNRGLSVRIETYDRRLDRLIVGRLETEAEREQRVAEYLPQYWAGPLQTEIPTDPLITSVPVNAGSGHAYGLEVLLTKRPRSAGTRLTGWVSYTLSKADRETYGLTYPFDYDRRHAASVVADVRVSPRVTMSAALQAAAGFPVTVPNGVRVATQAGTTTSGQPFVFPAVGAATYAYEVDYGSLSGINSSRLPVTSRVDVRATLHPRDGNGHWTFYVDVINVLDHRNQLAVFSDLKFNPSGPKPIIVNTYGGGFPIIPSLGLKYRF
ncbi:MAG TPA: TonB-dependent receptor [Vicinamibacterales bacterium]|nr:TonB-dependent receptor [Vicinamibacterales bacterium]